MPRKTGHRGGCCITPARALRLPRLLRVLEGAQHGHGNPPFAVSAKTTWRGTDPSQTRAGGTWVLHLSGLAPVGAATNKHAKGTLKAP